MKALFGRRLAAVKAYRWSARFQGALQGDSPAQGRAEGQTAHEPREKGKESVTS